MLQHESDTLLVENLRLLPLPSIPGSLTISMLSNVVKSISHLTDVFFFFFFFVVVVFLFVFFFNFFHVLLIFESQKRLNNFNKRSKQIYFQFQKTLLCRFLA